MNVQKKALWEGQRLPKRPDKSSPLHPVLLPTTVGFHIHEMFIIIVPISKRFPKQ